MPAAQPFRTRLQGGDSLDRGHSPWALLEFRERMAQVEAEMALQLTSLQEMERGGEL